MARERPEIALDVTTTASPGGGARNDDNLPRGTSLGRYVLLARLGVGGMGIVYAAYDPELDRRIALKLLRYGTDGQTPVEQRARLLREAQAMARLNHPNVIAVHDVGMFDERVFVAMELVEGETLEAWLDAEERSVAETLAVFVQAGRGLAAAHARGLVHRDFKPDNALLGADGRVRVLDFGLAYAVEAPDDAPSATNGRDPSTPDAPLPTTESPSRLTDPLTRAGALLGTPWYMSPEQLGGVRPDARSDQWSFCCALHEALYGQHPYAGVDDRNVASLVKRVRSGARREVPAATAAKIPLRVRKALDRGLATDPAARFDAMTELLAELEPLPARGRHVGWLAAGAVVVLGLAGGAYALRAKPGAACEGASHELDGVWNGPRKAAVAKAFEVTGKPFAQDALSATTHALDEYAAAWTGMQREACEATRVRGVQSEELLDLRTACLSDRRTELRALVDVLAKADVEAVEHAPGAARALSSLAPCANAALLRAPTKLPNDAAKRDAVVTVRERVATARALERAGRSGEMLAAAKEAAALAETTDYLPARAEAGTLLGRAAIRALDSRSAEASLERAITLAEASHDDAIAAEAWTALVLAQANLFSFERADDSARYGAAAILRIGGDTAREAELESARSILERHRGHYDDAVTHARAALALTERASASDPRVVDLLVDLALVLNLQAKYDDAIAALTRARAIAEAALGPAHPQIARILAALSTVYEYRGDAAQALSYAKQAVEITERALGPDHPILVGQLIALGNAEEDAGDLEGTAAAYQRALAILERIGGPETAQKGDVLNSLARVLAEQGAFTASLASAERGLAIHEKLQGPSHSDVADALETVGNALCALGRCKEALAAHERALAIFEATYGGVHPDVGTALLGVGRDQRALHENAAAIASLERAVDVLGKVEVPEAVRADAAFALAQALSDGGGNRARALLLAKEARELLTRSGRAAATTVAEIDAWTLARAR